MSICISFTSHQVSSFCQLYRGQSGFKNHIGAAIKTKLWPSLLPLSSPPIHGIAQPGCGGSYTITTQFRLARFSDFLLKVCNQPCSSLPPTKARRMRLIWFKKNLEQAIIYNFEQMKWPLLSCVIKFHSLKDFFFLFTNTQLTFINKTGDFMANAVQP